MYCPTDVLGRPNVVGFDDTVALLGMAARDCGFREIVMKIKRMGRTGLKVSEICLGTMTFGKQCDEATSFAIMEAAVDREWISSTLPMAIRWAAISKP